MNSQEVVEQALKSFNHVVQIAPYIHKVRNRSEYEEALSFTEFLMGHIGDNPNDPAWPMLEAVTNAITQYEDGRDPAFKEVNDKSGVAILSVLMRRHDLTQKELPEIGSQGVVSEVLSGKRQLNIKQIRALAERFDVDPSVFI